MLLYSASYVSRATDGVFHSYSLPVGNLTNTGDMLLVDFGYATQNGGTGTITLSFGSAAIAIPNFASSWANGDDGRFLMRVIRTGATTQRVVGMTIGTINTGSHNSVQFVAGTETLSGSVTISSSASGIGGGNTIIGGPFTVTLYEV